MTQSILKGIAVGALALAAVAAAAPSAMAQDGKQIRIGAIVPSSGPFAEWGRTNTVTLKMLEDKVNAAGGVNGAKLEIVIYDDATKPAQAANSLRKLAGDDNVLAVAGPLTSSACEVTFPVANQMEIVAMSQASSKPGVAANNRPWAFRNTVDEAILAEESVPYLVDTFDVKDVAVIYDAKDAVSTAIATKIMPGILKEHGVEVLNDGDFLSFNTGELDVSAQVTKIISLDPDAVVIGADYSEAITVIREMRRQGFVKPVIGGTPLISSAILHAAPDIPIIAPATFYASMDEPRAKEFVAELQPLLKETSGLPESIEPSMYDANIYENVSMFIEAVEKAGVTGNPDDLAADRTKIRDYITNLKGFEGLGGPISFNKDGDAEKAFFIVRGEGEKWTTVVHGCSSQGGDC
ncbi:ABC transporter substrate-binding protein [Microbaculum marinum]|uniref:ABC transporter substrate-binding protein n=2 Tax=Microbaculum marinum TaxID=1764581 RepID=A0AAW9RQW3_9HYPH